MLPCRVQQIFTSNAQPNSSDILAIRRELDIRRDELNALQARVQELESENRMLESLLAPLHRLAVPPEIVAEIFLFVLSTVTDNRKIAAQVTDLCLVCRRWKEIALATPQLWTTVWMTLHKQDDDLRSVQRWIDRGADAPKNVRIFEPDGRDRLHHPMDKCSLNNRGLANMLATTPSILCLSIICAEMTCLQNLIVDLIRPSGREDLWRSLHSLEMLVNLGAGWEDLNPGFKHFLEFLPPVASLTLGLGPHYDGGNPPCLDLGSTKVLQLACDWDLQWILGSLGTGKNLVEITFDCRSGGYLDLLFPGNHQMCTLPNTKTLRLRNLIRDGEELDICRWFVMPLLEDLDISFANGNDDPSHFLADWEPTVVEAIEIRITKLLARSGRSHSLKRLRLHDLWDMSIEDTSQLLKTQHSLEHLTLDHCFLESIFFDRLDAAPHQHRLPSLKTLELLNIDSTKTRFDIEHIYAFFRRRSTLTPMGVAEEDFKELDGNRTARIEKVVVTLQSPEVDLPYVPYHIPAHNDAVCDVSVVDHVDYRTMCGASSFAYHRDS